MTDEEKEVAKRLLAIMERGATKDFIGVLSSVENAVYFKSVKMAITSKAFLCRAAKQLGKEL